ncbi:MAG: hypothetical protein HOH43_09985 [Candidatus Latescibacteria bacterium]|jgi:hypothetical protein|nr:hypothetical protein [Candidatus Latescibacterota bacterium]
MTSAKQSEMESMTRDGQFLHGKWYPVTRHKGPSIDGLIMSYVFHGRGDVWRPLRFTLAEFLYASTGHTVASRALAVEILEMKRDTDAEFHVIIGKSPFGRVMIEWNTTNQTGRVRFLAPPKKKAYSAEQASEAFVPERPRLVIDVLRERRGTEEEIRPFYEELRGALPSDLRNWVKMGETGYGCWTLSIAVPGIGEAVFFTEEYDLYPGRTYGIRAEIVAALVRPVKQK